MKLSLRWICDYLVGIDWNSLNVEDLVFRFNTHVAEIEHADAVSCPVQDYFVAVADGAGFSIPETGERVSNLSRSDSVQGQCYLVKRVADGYAFVTLADLGMDKDGLLTTIFVAPEDRAGAWREQWEEADILLDVDNKSITHRPDMWGHRGFAREIAAIMNASFKDEAEFLADLAPHFSSGSTEKGSGIALRNEAHEACSMVAGLTLSGVSNRASDLHMVSRFVKIGYRPHNAVVDITNYVMADWGHPMHAYDASCFQNSQLVVRMAQAGEMLTLLDDSEVELNDADIVIADTDKVLGLAGIMGGKFDSFSDATTDVLLEAACFSASHIRRSALRHKARTEASQRFEKTLDPMMAIAAIQRFCNLADSLGVSYTIVGNLTAVGEKIERPRISLSHASLTSKLGLSLSVDQVCAFLEKLSFDVATHHDASDVVYSVSVPTFRASKDIKIEQDLIEEVARLYGFDNIPAQLPSLAHRASSLRKKATIRRIKDFLAVSGMYEQRNYAFYDEALLKKLSWPRREQALRLKNPVSKNAVELVGSLLPHLLKNVIENRADHDSIRFFEVGRVWNGIDEQAEHDSCALVWFDKRNEIDFYEFKSVVQSLFGVIGGRVSWEKAKDAPAWAAPGRCADLILDGASVGVCGQVDVSMVQRCGGLPESTMMMCEFNLSALLEQPQKQLHIGSSTFFQGSTFDVSCMISLDKTVAHLEGAIARCSLHVERVALIDFFEKKEWSDKRSVAFRVWLRHPERSMHAEEIEHARAAVISCLEEQGAHIRSS